MSEIEKRLDKLAQEINEEHRSFRRAFKATYRSALRAGDLLNEAKGEAGHGNWTAWIEENCEFSDRTARVYMRLANNREKVEEILAKTAEPADLSIHGILTAIATPKERPITRERVEGPLRWAGKEYPRELEKQKKDMGLKPAFARGLAQAAVPEVKNAVERKAEELGEKGEAFPAEEREAYAKRVAEMKKRTREREAREREERRKAHTRMFLDVDASLSKARQALKEALDVVKDDIEFDEEEVELLERELEATQATLRLLSTALTGDSGTDWDAELYELEGRRQWGDSWEEHR